MLLPRFNASLSGMFVFLCGGDILLYIHFQLLVLEMPSITIVSVGQ